MFSTSIEQGGTGVGNQGGFNIGPHVAFRGMPPRYTNPGGYNRQRYFEFEVDTRHLDSIITQVIRGTGFNGGEEPDVNEDLRLYYEREDGTWVLLKRYLRLSSIYNTLRDVSITLPEEAKKYGRFRFIQFTNSSDEFSGLS